MAEKIKTIFKNNMMVCILLITLISLTTCMFASDFTIKAGALEQGTMLGSYSRLDSDGNNIVAGNTFPDMHYYLAQTDGFVIVNNGGTGLDIGISPDANGDIADVCGYQNAMAPVKKGNYFRVWGTPTATIFWVPIGQGGAPIRQ